MDVQYKNLGQIWPISHVLSKIDYGILDVTEEWLSYVLIHLIPEAADVEVIMGATFNERPDVELSHYF